MGNSKNYTAEDILMLKKKLDITGSSFSALMGVSNSLVSSWKHNPKTEIDLRYYPKLDLLFELIDDSSIKDNEAHQADLIKEKLNEVRENFLSELKKGDSEIRLCPWCSSKCKIPQKYLSDHNIVFQCGTCSESFKLLNDTPTKFVQLTSPAEGIPFIKGNKNNGD